MSNQQPKWSTNREGDIYADLGAGKLNYVACAPRIDDARRIVRAVNAHEPMLAALRDHIEWWDQRTKGWPGENPPTLEACRAAIAIAEGKQ